jgi:beta-N-acetylhexosaminidase
MKELQKILSAFCLIWLSLLHGQAEIVEQVNQLLLVAVPATPDDASFEETIRWLESSQVANLLISTTGFGPGSLQEKAQRVQAFKKAVLASTGLDPFLAADQEGGRVQRILGTPIPPPLLMKEEDVGLLASSLAYETSLVGINMCLGPVLDIPAEGNFINDRAFGKDPSTVIRRASLWIDILKSYGLLVVGKHFPGHGSSSSNSHLFPSFVDKPWEALQTWDLKPFMVLLPKLDAIMSAHVYFSQIDPDSIGTYSHIIMTDLLKGYQGLRLSDSISMLAATPEQFDFEQSAAAMAFNAIKSVNAGCDLIILGVPEFGPYRPDIKEQRSFIDRTITLFVQAIKNGAVSEGRLREALNRIQIAKAQIAAFDVEKLVQ